jgi:hypothetical protein
VYKTETTLYTHYPTKIDHQLVMSDNLGLTRLQRIFFWLGFLAPIPSIILYVFLTEGTVEYFGGTPSPTALFWCSIAASGDSIVSAMSYSVLKYPRNMELRRSVLWGMAVYSIFHFGGFLRAHYTHEPHPAGPVGYFLAIITTWAAYFAWGLPRGDNIEQESLITISKTNASSGIV